MMNRNRRVLQALFVTLLGGVAHLTSPAPEASATARSSCLPRAQCAWVCSWGPAICPDCEYICVVDHQICSPFAIFEACLSPI